MDRKWYEAKMGNHQGLIVDEKTGANIAVVYDKKNAPLIAAAPELAEALVGLVSVIDAGCSRESIENGQTIKFARAALRNAGVEV